MGLLNVKKIEEFSTKGILEWGFSSSQLFMKKGDMWQ